ncbi:hypothetical protein VTI28DRAFT_6666 [Corynascus sepedonium]
MDTITGSTTSSDLQADEPSPKLRTLKCEPGGICVDIIDAAVPEVRATTEECFRAFDRDNVTHVVIQVTISRQAEIFRHVGYQYDWDWPGPFWEFLGKIAAKGVFDGKTELRELNYIPLGRREFIAYTTSMWTAVLEAGKVAGTAQAERPPVKVVEVSFKKPQPGQPLELRWAPARGPIDAKIKEWSEQPGGGSYDYIEAN